MYRSWRVSIRTAKDEPKARKSFQQAVAQMEKAVAMAPLHVEWKEHWEFIKGKL